MKETIQRSVFGEKHIFVYFFDIYAFHESTKQFAWLVAKITNSLATAKIAIFCTDMLWKSCLKSYLEQLSHSMSVAKIASLAVAKKLVFPWIRA